MSQKRYKDFFKRAPVGKYSGNIRLDPSILEEPDSDSEFTRNMALDDIPSDPDFQEDIRKTMEEKLKNVHIMSGIDPKNLRIHVVGQSHIDMAWRWRFEQTRRKGIITFRKAVYHARRFPDYRFALSQPQLLAWIEEDDPALFTDIKDVVGKGGIELVGGSWIEPDCMMPSGESLCRARLYGQRYYRDHYGKLAEVEWFTDSFGYSWGLPQILTKSGARFFFTSKITWNRQTVFPFVHFLWEGPDGSRLITCNFNMGLGPLDQWMKYEPGHHPIKKGYTYEADYTRDYYDIEDFVAPEEVIPAIGYFCGKGDGGHGPTHLEVATMNEQVRIGYAKWSTVGNYFKDVAQWQDRLPIWRDELYLEYHRGTFSVHAEVKRHNRLFENGLISIDNLTSMLAAFNPQYARPSVLLEEMWKVLLLNQFHDVLPGSSIPEVYDDIYDDWGGLDAACKWVYDEAGKAISVPAETNLLLYNPTPTKRKGPVFIPTGALPEIITSRGVQSDLELISLGAGKGVFLAQAIKAESNEWVDARGPGWWAVVELEPLSITPFQVIAVKKDLPNPIAGAAALHPFLDNGIVRVELDPATGGITKLASTLVPNMPNLVQGNQSNLNVAFLDDFPSDHAWNIKPEYWKYPIAMRNDEEVTIRLVEQRNVFATLEISRVLGEVKSKVTQRVMLFTACPEVYLEWIADWQESYRMIKVVFDTATDADKCTADAAYCPITRSTRPKARPDWARYEKIMHKYADLSTPDNTWGIALLNEGRYAFDATGGQIRLTMLRSPVYPTPAPEAWVIKERQIREKAGKGTVPKFSGIGPFRCRYALLPHPAGALQTHNGTPSRFVKDRADEFNAPVVVLPFVPQKNPNKVDSLADGCAWVTSSPANVAVTAIKPNEWDKNGNLILRVVEECGLDVEGVATIQLHAIIAKKIKAARAVDILERPLSDNRIKWDPKKGLIALPLRHFEIATIELIT